MKLTIKEVNKAMDNVLPFFVVESYAKNLKIIAIRQIALINSEASNQVERLFGIMEDNNLIHGSSKDSYELTEFGKEVLENGGWLKHINRIQEERQKDQRD